MKPKIKNNPLIDVSYFIKYKEIFKEQDGYLAKNFRIIENNTNILSNKDNIEISENIINENKVKTNINTPFPKLSYNFNQNKNNNKYNFEINSNYLIKKKNLSNSITNTPSRNYRINMNKANSLDNNKKNIIHNKKINYPYFLYNNNIKNKNNKEKSLNNTIGVNVKNSLDNCMTICQEKNINDEDDKINKYINKKSVEVKLRNLNSIKFKFNGNFKKEDVNIYNNSNHKVANINDINNDLNVDKFKYKNRKIFHQKYFKLNNIFSFTNSSKELNKKENHKKEKEVINNSNSEGAAKTIKEKIVEKSKKNTLTENSPSKKLKTEQRESSFSHENRYDKVKPIKNKNKPNNLIHIFSLRKFKVKPKLKPITKLDKFPISYETKENVNKKYFSKLLLSYNLTNNLNMISINSPTEKYYYTINKMYRNQLPEYMKHRVNWELIELKKLSPQEQKNININFEWKYLSSKLNFKKYKYEPGVNLPNNKYKMVNLFERNYEIGNKRNMFINLISYCDKINLNAFDFVPFTVTINYSKDYEQFLEALKEIINFINSKKDYNNKEDLITNRKYNEHFWFDKNFDYLENQYININKNFFSDKNYWIIKPPDLYQGKCIEISNNYDEIRKTCKNMFKGVDKRFNPDLTINLEEEDSDEEKNNANTNSNINSSLYNQNNINKNNIYINLNNSGSDIELKSDGNALNNSIEIINNVNMTNSNTTRNKKNIKKKIYSRITCFNEIIVQKYLDNPLLYKKRKFDIRCYVLVDSNLNVFFCREGHLKGSSELYNLNKTNKFIHITNHSLQKKSLKFEQYEYGNEMSYSDFKSFMKEENIPLENFDKMIEQMKFLVKISFKSVGSKLLRITPVLCFEIFGYDFILDNDFRPWILEINNNPGLGISSPVIEKLVPRMLDDALRLTIDKVFDTKYSNECIDENNNYKSKYKLEGFNDEENVFEFLCNVG